MVSATLDDSQLDLTLRWPPSTTPTVNIPTAFSDSENCIRNLNGMQRWPNAEPPELDLKVPEIRHRNSDAKYIDGTKL